VSKRRESSRHETGIVVGVIGELDPSPKREVITSAHAPDCVECPEEYSGKIADR
jgi:hypothetical protein